MDLPLPNRDLVDDRLNLEFRVRGVGLFKRFSLVEADLEGALR